MYNFIDSRNAPIYKVPVGIANLGGTDEAENIVTIMAMVIMTRERLREHD